MGLLWSNNDHNTINSTCMLLLIILLGIFVNNVRMADLLSYEQIYIIDVYFIVIITNICHSAIITVCFGRACVQGLTKRTYVFLAPIPGVFIRCMFVFGGLFRRSGVEQRASSGITGWL